MDITHLANTSSKKLYNPTEKFDNREHPMLSDESPLNRQLLQATNMPDMKALLHALAYHMTEGDLEGVAEKAGGHLAHHHRIRHLRKLALKQHGHLPAAEDSNGNEPVEKSGSSIKKAVLWRRLGKEGSGVDLGSQSRVPHSARGHYTGPGGPTPPLKTTGLNPRIDHSITVNNMFGKHSWEKVHEWGKRGGRWFINAAGHQEYGVAPPPFRAKVLDDKNPDDRSITKHFTSLGVEHSWHGNEILYSKPEELHAHAVAVATYTGQHPRDIEKRLIEKQAEAKRQFKAHRMHSIEGLHTRETVPLDVREMEKQRKAGTLEDHKRKLYYHHVPMTDAKTGQVITQPSKVHRKDTQGNPVYDDKGQPVMDIEKIPQVDAEGKPVYNKKNKPVMIAKRVPKTQEVLKDLYRVRNNVVHRRELKKDETGKPTIVENPITEEKDVPITKKTTTNRATGQEEETWDTRDIDPEYVGNLVRFYRGIDKKTREETGKWYTKEAEDYIRDLADATGQPFMKVAGVLALFNNSMGWEIGATGAAQALYGHDMGIKYTTDNKLGNPASGLSAHEKGEPMTIVPIFGAVREKMNGIINAPNNDYEKLKAAIKKGVGTNKLGNFFMDMIGASPWQTNTIDRHQIKIIGYKRVTRGKDGKLKSKVPEGLSPQEYRYFYRVMTAAAHQLGIKPQELQAATWVAYRDKYGRSAAGTDFTQYAGLRARVHADAEARRAGKKKGEKQTSTTPKNIPYPNTYKPGRFGGGGGEGDDDDEEEDLSASFRDYSSRIYYHRKLA